MCKHISISLPHNRLSNICMLVFENLSTASKLLPINKKFSCYFVFSETKRKWESRGGCFDKIVKDFYRNK